MKYDKERLTKIVSAIVISDGHLSKVKGNGNSGLSLAQIKPHEDLIMIVKKELQVLTEVTMSERIMKKETHNDQYFLRTRKHPFYTKLRKRFYIEGKKVVDPHALTLLDGEFLAYWFMFDGSYYYTPSNYAHNLTLCTDGFSYGDHVLMQKELFQRLNLNFRIHRRKDTYRLYLPKKEYKKFVKLVEPYMCESFRYKIPLLESRTFSPSKEGGEIVCAS